MPRVLRAGADWTQPPRVWGTTAGVVASVLRCIILGLAAWLLSKVAIPPDSKAKLYGSVLTTVSFVFTLQEFLFFQARGRIGETLKSAATPPADLRPMLQRSKNLKAYLDRTWIWALASKIAGLIAGPLLFSRILEHWRILPDGPDLLAEDLLSILGWFCLMNGAFLTLKTFRAFMHVDSVLAEMEVEAREIAAGKASAAAIEAAPVEDWQKDPDLKGYKRTRPNPRKPK